MIVIIVEPAKRRDGSAIAGTYFASLEGEAQPLAVSRAPLLCAARVLLARGFAPEERIAMRWRGDSFDSLAAPLGVAAGLAVEEGPPMRFVRYRPLPQLRAASKSYP
jgi:hypothetical protein